MRWIKSVCKRVLLGFYHFCHATNIWPCFPRYHRFNITRSELNIYQEGLKWQNHSQLAWLCPQPRRVSKPGLGFRLLPSRPRDESQPAISWHLLQQKCHIRWASRREESQFDRFRRASHRNPIWVRIWETYNQRDRQYALELLWIWQVTWHFFRIKIALPQLQLAVTPTISCLSWETSTLHQILLMFPTL